MSRGLGKLQLFWLKVAANDEGTARPWTFEELCRSAWPEAYEDGFVMRPAFKRSLRRALRTMIDHGHIIPLGQGGRADPHRYIVNPSRFSPDDPRRERVMQHLTPFGFYWRADGVLMISGHARSRIKS